jgi:hypothetical protein
MPNRLVTSIKTYLKGATALLQLGKVPLSQEPLNVTGQDLGLLVISAAVYTQLRRELNPKTSELESSSRSYIITYATSDPLLRPTTIRIWN